MFNLDDEQTLLQTSLMDTDDEEINNIDREWGQFKLVKGRDGPAAFLPISEGLGRNNKAIPRHRDCLMP